MTESTTARPSRAILAAVLTLLTVNAGGMAWLIQESRVARADTSTRMTKVERSLTLLRMEATSPYGGKGFDALLEHLQFWAPKLQKSRPGTSDRFFVEERVAEIVETMSFLPNVYPRIEAAFLSVEANSGDTASDEVRRHLLIAAHAAEPKKGIELIVRVLEAKDVVVGIPLRRFAASELLQVDRDRAGVILHTLLIKAMQTPASVRLGGQNRGLHPQQVFNYLDDYVASGHPEVEKTLLRILMKSEYQDEFTIQRCVEHLGEMKSRAAVNRIKSLYMQQAPVPGQVSNPLFRRKCMIAVVETIGAEAVPFLREIDQKESDTGIRAKLDEYKKQFDFSKK